MPLDDYFLGNVPSTYPQFYLNGTDFQLRILSPNNKKTRVRKSFSHRRLSFYSFYLIEKSFNLLLSLKYFLTFGTTSFP